MSTLRYLTVVLLAAMALAGCDRSPEVAVIDVDAVAKAIGRDEVIKQQMQAAREQLAQQLSQRAEVLKERLEQTPSQESEAEARRVWQQAMTLAEQRAREYQLVLIAEFTEQLRPVTEKIARAHGVRVVFSARTSTVWFEPEADLTGAVIAELRANPLPATRHTTFDAKPPSAPEEPPPDH
jgi:Skp family chaperone for outer membrane proteins